MECVQRLCRRPRTVPKFSEEILSLHVVFKTVEDQLCDQGFKNKTLTLSTKHVDDLKILRDGLKTTLMELDALLKKYQSLIGNHSISFDRLKWGKEDLAELRERILVHVGLLTAFNLSLTRCVHIPNPSVLENRNI